MHLNYKNRLVAFFCFILVNSIFCATHALNTAPNYSNLPIVSDLFDAVSNDKTKKVEQIIKHNPEIINLSKFKSGTTAIAQASISGYKEIVEILITAKADVDLQNRLGWNGLLYAIIHRKPEIVPLLLDAGANKQVKNSLGYTPLKHATDMGQNKIVELLTQKRLK